LFGAGANACRQACSAPCSLVHGATQTGIIRPKVRGLQPLPTCLALRGSTGLAII
jgi:hypothetical protein